MQFESTHTDVMYREGTLSPDRGTLTAAGQHVNVATGRPAEVRTLTTLLDDLTFTLRLLYALPRPARERRIVLTQRRRASPE